MSLLRSIFWRFLRHPKAGETWEFIPAEPNNPFGRTHRVIVLDVRGAWVRYSMGKVFNNESAHMSMFLGCYKPPTLTSPATPHNQTYPNAAQPQE